MYRVITYKGKKHLYKSNGRTECGIDLVGCETNLQEEVHVPLQCAVSMISCERCFQIISDINKTKNVKIYSNT